MPLVALAQDRRVRDTLVEQQGKGRHRPPPARAHLRSALLPFSASNCSAVALTYNPNYKYRPEVLPARRLSAVSSRRRYELTGKKDGNLQRLAASSGDAR
jgi:hypothetical protein